MHTAASADEAEDRGSRPFGSDIQSTGTVVRFVEVDPFVFRQLETIRAENKIERKKPLLQKLAEEQAERNIARAARARRRAPSAATSHEKVGDAAEEIHDMPSSAGSINPVSQ